jgi:hypothetical protein
MNCNICLNDCNKLDFINCKSCKNTTDKNVCMNCFYKLKHPKSCPYCKTEYFDEDDNTPPPLLTMALEFVNEWANSDDEYLFGATLSIIALWGQLTHLNGHE